MVKPANFFIDPNKIHDEAPRVIQVSLDDLYKICAKVVLSGDKSAAIILAEVLSLGNHRLDQELLDLHIKKELENS